MSLNLSLPALGSYTIIKAVAHNIGKLHQVMYDYVEAYRLTSVYA